MTFLVFMKSTSKLKVKIILNILLKKTKLSCDLFYMKALKGYKKKPSDDMTCNNQSTTVTWDVLSSNLRIRIYC